MNSVPRGQCGALALLIHLIRVADLFLDIQLKKSSFETLSELENTSKPTGQVM